MSMPLIF